jgi:hypothetical protein
MSEQDRDDGVLEALARAVQAVDPVPPEVLFAAKEAFTWRSIDEELAMLTFDSLVDAVAGVRGSGPRAVTFEAGEVVIEIEVGEQGTSRSLTGQVVAEDLSEVELHVPTTARPIPVEVDRSGRFRTGAVPAGPIRLRCRLGDEGRRRILTTEWVVV